MSENKTKVIINHDIKDLHTVRVFLEVNNERVSTTIGDTIEVNKEPQAEIQDFKYYVCVKNKNIIDVPMTHTFIYCNEVEDNR